MKFVMSYSCGKDSTLALHKMLEAGNEAVALIVMVNEEADRSYFHGADQTMLEGYSEALDIPLIITPTKGEDYHLAMEKSLKKAKQMGAEAACFGDIDLEGNREWSEMRCKNVGLTAVFPLWQKNREENVKELIRLGYQCLIKSINNTLLPERILGRVIDDDAIRIMDDRKIDICGENGEYHTLVVDGPIFQKSLRFQTGEVLRFGDYSVIDVYCLERI